VDQQSSVPVASFAILESYCAAGGYSMKLQTRQELTERARERELVGNKKNKSNNKASFVTPSPSPSLLPAIE
jgi:hypothetical protein